MGAAPPRRGEEGADTQKNERARAWTRRRPHAQAKPLEVWAAAGLGPRFQPGSARRSRQAEQMTPPLPAGCPGQGQRPKHLLGSGLCPLQCVRVCAKVTAPECPSPTTSSLFLHWNLHSGTVEPGAWWALRGGSDGGSIPGRVRGTASAQLPSRGPRTEGLHLPMPCSHRLTILRDFKERPYKLLLRGFIYVCI